MFTPGRDMFLLIPDGSDERILYPGVVVEAPKGALVTRFNDPISPSVGSTVFAHCEVNRKFMQQAATVTAVLKTDPQPMFAFTLTGQPISAETRSVYRVSVAAAGNVWATLNRRAERCLVHDLSATGFGLMSSAVLQRGEEVEATISYDGRTYHGKARVQSIRPRPKGEFRYGFHAIESRGKAAADSLNKGLGLISAAVQREQLRRLAGA